MNGTCPMPVIRGYGYSEINTKAVKKVVFLHGKWYTILPALTLDGIIAIDIMENSYCNRDVVCNGAKDKGICNGAKGKVACNDDKGKDSCNNSECSAKDGIEDDSQIKRWFFYHYSYLSKEINSKL
ncbi:hypothetical protein C2G38_2041205 [Gigaspora rosea]|uniref:Uncharacterized protein n=1 Tax=Gigaspora rosea TaxID=44941 RepID=A0A397V1I6_9GLOM|nr:hypothetical protein C2G38_2041205 [Gigaspora rosea]